MAQGGHTFSLSLSPSLTLLWGFFWLHHPGQRVECLIQASINRQSGELDEAIAVKYVVSIIIL